MEPTKQIKRHPVKAIIDLNGQPVTPAQSEDATDQMPEKYSKAWWAKFWREQIRPLAILLTILCCVRSSLADWNTVPSGSMKPTIIEGDRIFVNKLAYDLKVPFTTWHIAQWGNPSRGEIVVFDSPKDGTRLVKRVIGVPGDTVELVNNHLIINGQQAVYSSLDKDTQDQITPAEKIAAMPKFATETFLNVTHAMMEMTVNNGAFMNHQAFPATFPAVVVPPGQYFMMGDNRDNSADSRFIGFVPRQNIIGRSSRVVMSLNYDNYYIPRSNRFFRPLP